MPHISHTIPSSGGGAPSGAAGGDLSGTYPNPGVAQLNGVAASAYATLANAQTITGSKLFTAGFRYDQQAVSGTATLVDVTQPLVVVDTTSAAFTITLPAAPSAGSIFIFVDKLGTWATNNLTLARNGKNIDGAAANKVCATNNGIVAIQYNGTDWRTIWDLLSSANPVMDGTAAAGTSQDAARADHVHPSDTSRAPLASPTFTGTVTLPEGNDAAAGTASRRTLGTGATQAMQGSLAAPLASPALTGTPTVPTAAPGTNTTQAASTAYADAIAALKANLASPTFTGTVTQPIGTISSGATNSTLQTPEGLGLLEWNGALYTTGTGILTSGTKYVLKMVPRVTRNVTNVVLMVTVAGSGLTSAQNLVALYNSSGTKLGSDSADQTTPWASTGVKTIAIGGGAQSLTAGSVYYVEILSVGTTPPTMSKLTANILAINFGASAANSWVASNGTGATATDASFTPSSLTITGGSPSAFWVGLS